MAWLKRDIRGLNTNLDNLYNTIKQVLEDEKNLIISQEFNGKILNHYGIWDIALSITLSYLLISCWYRYTK
jgi:hypothetical protein